jgi:hypothetical protein
LLNEVNARRINDELNVFEGIHKSPIFLGVLLVTAGLQVRVFARPCRACGGGCVQAVFARPCRVLVELVVCKGLCASREVAMPPATAQQANSCLGCFPRNPAGANAAERAAVVDETLVCNASVLKGLLCFLVLLLLLLLLLLLPTGHHHADACWSLLQGHSHQWCGVGYQHRHRLQRCACQRAHAPTVKVGSAAVRDTASPQQSGGCCGQQVKLDWELVWQGSG